MFELPVRAADLFKHEFPEEPCYIGLNVLTKGGTLLLGGQAKVGKSLLMMEVIRALTTASPLFYNPVLQVPAKTTCLYIEAENGPRTVKERGLKIFNEEHESVWGDHFHVLSLKNPPQLDTGKGYAEYKAMILDVRPNVLLLDPISFMHGQDENDNRGIGKIYYILNSFKELVPEQELAIVISHHFGKRPWGAASVGYDPLSQYNFRGASKWKDGADTIITMDRFAELGLPWEAWKLQLRFLCRHGSAPHEGKYLVNAANDFKTVHEETHKKIALPPLQFVHPTDKIDFNAAFGNTSSGTGKKKKEVTHEQYAL